MTPSLQQYIEALRQELQQYGEMLALLDAPHKRPVGCGNDPLARPLADINTQVRVLHAARQQSRASQRRLAASLGEPVHGAFSRLILRVPEPYRGLVNALVQENRELLARVRERAEQNRALLGRSLEALQQFTTAWAREEREPTLPPSPSASELTAAPEAMVA